MCSMFQYSSDLIEISKLYVQLIRDFGALLWASSTVVWSFQLLGGFMWATTKSTVRLQYHNFYVESCDVWYQPLPCVSNGSEIWCWKHCDAASLLIDWYFTSLHVFAVPKCQHFTIVKLSKPTVLCFETCVLNPNHLVRADVVAYKEPENFHTCVPISSSFSDRRAS